MAKKKFVLRIDEETMKAVERWAAEEFRSLNGQLEWMITRMLQQANRMEEGIGDGDGEVPDGEEGEEEE